MNGGPVWVGLDAGVDCVSVCAINETGETLREWAVAASATALSGDLEELGASGRLVIGIEAGSTAIPLTRGLRKTGYEVRVLETRHLSGFLHVRQNKTDRNDARGIAEATRIGLGVVPEVMVKSVQCQSLRSELVLRVQLMHQRIAIDNAIRAVLRLNGARIGTAFSGTHLEKCVNLELDRLRAAGNDITDVVAPPLAIAVAMHRVLERGLRRLERIAKANDVCRRLMTVPGVGPVCAISFFTAIEDPGRFKNNDDAGPYFGLVPKVSQSGQTLRRVGISKMGNTMTRTHLVTAAKSLMQQSKQDCELRRWAFAVAERAGKPKARIALARKLAVVMLAMWKSGQTFNPEPGRSPGAARQAGGAALRIQGPGGPE